MSAVLIIYNPVSGNRKLYWTKSRIQSYLENNTVDFEWYDTQKENLDEFTSKIHKDLDRLIVIGGDGTVHEVINFLLGHKIDIPVAIVANGTGNVIAGSLGIPQLSFRRALDVANAESPKRMDAMCINTYLYGIIACGQGYDVEFIDRAPRRLKRYIGFGAYLYSFMTTFFSYPNVEYEIEVDGVRSSFSAKFVLVCNMMALKGCKIDPAIKSDDGLLDVICVAPRSLLDCIRIAMTFVLRRPKEGVVGLQLFKGKSIMVDRAYDKKIEIDGEVYQAENLQIEVIPNALSIVHA